MCNCTFLVFFVDFISKVIDCIIEDNNRRESENTVINKTHLCYLCKKKKKYNITELRQHLLGHGVQLPFTESEFIRWIILYHQNMSKHINYNIQSVELRKYFYSCSFFIIIFFFNSYFFTFF